MFVGLITAVVLSQVSPPPPPFVPRVPVQTPMMPPADIMNGGLTVVGIGQVSAQADNAQVTLRVSARNNAPTLTAQTLQPFADALVRAGADRSSIQFPPYLVGNARVSMATVTASVHHPTVAQLQQGMLTIANAFAANPDMLLNSADVRLSAENCSALQRSAESNAIANARANAGFIAKQIGKHLGGVLAVDARGATVRNDSCFEFYSIGPFGASDPRQSLADMLTIKIDANVTLRYAIEP